jgi:plasmid stabilization system protein ParE
MDVKFSVTWTPESKTKVDKIIKYLQDNWGDAEVEKFLDLLQQFEKTISTYPYSYKSSSK